MLDWLSSLEGRPWNLGLERVSALLEKLGNPHQKLRCIHVAGTNGKGSVCAMLASIYQAAGYHIGLYISPHLRVLNERIQVGGRHITDSRLSRLLSEIRPHHTDQTYFEVLTAAAFLFFAQERADLCIIETGLGGRLDATNVITPLISAITAVSLEHVQHLGDTVEKIAEEKAGIIKRGVPVAVAAKGGPFRVIRRAARKQGSRLIRPRRPRRRGGTFSVGRHRDLFLNLLGEFQLRNAALALAIVDAEEMTGAFPVPEEAIANGLFTVEWPGRMELHGQLLLDAAHNPDGVAVLRDEVKRLPHDKVIGVVGILKEKDREEMLRIFSSFCDYLIFTEAHSPRATAAEELASLFSSLFPRSRVRHEVIRDVNKGVKRARKLAGTDDIILVAGSLYLVGEVKV